MQSLFTFLCNKSPSQLNLQDIKLVMQQNIVLVVDYSTETENLLKFYLDRLHRLGNKLVLVHCIQLPEYSIDTARDNHISPTIFRQLWQEEEVKRDALEKKVRNLLSERKVCGTLKSACGRRRDIVCRVAEEVDAAYVVIGDGASSSRSVGGKMWRAVVSGARGRHHSGSDLVDYLLRSLTCPLVVVRDAPGRRSKPTSVDGVDEVDEGIDGRSRNFSGDAVASITSRIRRIRFASGGTRVVALKGSGPSSTSLIGDRSQMVDQAIEL